MGGKGIDKNEETNFKYSIYIYIAFNQKQNKKCQSLKTQSTEISCS
jgi:hypothetical protein